MTAKTLLPASLLDLSQTCETPLPFLAALHYRQGELDAYLQTLVQGLNHYLSTSSAALTFFQQNVEQVLVSTPNANWVQMPALISLTGWIGRTGKTLQSASETLPVEISSQMAPGLAYLGIPMKAASGRILGALCAWGDRPQQFSLEEENWAVLFADRAAMAIEHYLLQQEQTRLKAWFGLHKRR